MYIHAIKSLLLFDSLGLEGFKFFIVDNDETVIDEILYNFKKCKVSLPNQKLTLCTMKFSSDTWKKLVYAEKEQLTDVAQKLFGLLTEFPKLKKSKEMSILILEHPVQEITKSTCGLFQLYFIKTYLIQTKKVNL